MSSVIHSFFNNQIAGSLWPCPSPAQPTCPPPRRGKCGEPNILQYRIFSGVKQKDMLQVKIQGRVNCSERDNSCLIRDSHFYSISFRAFFFSIFDSKFLAPKVVLLHHAACITLCKVLLPKLDPKTTYFWRVDTKSGLIIA